MQQSLDDVCVVVPMFNEANVLEGVLETLLAVFPHVVCIDDGSSDNSPEIARRCGATVLKHVVNRGQGASLQTGFDYVRTMTDAEYCVTFDSDGQHGVLDALAMVDALRESGADIALASRFRGTTEGMSRMRGLVLKAGVWFTRRSAKLDVTDTHNGLRVLRRTALNSIRLRLDRMAHASELLSAIVPAGLSYIEVPVRVEYSEHSRAKGQANIAAINILFDLATAKLRASA